jgi:hypothetical protein
LLARPDAEAVPLDLGIEPSQTDDGRIVSHAVEPLDHAGEIVVLLTHCVDRKRRVLDRPARRLTDCRGCRRARQLVRRDVDAFTEEPLPAFDDEGVELRDIRDRDPLQATAVAPVSPEVGDRAKASLPQGRPPRRAAGRTPRRCSPAISNPTQTRCWQ